MQRNLKYCNQSSNLNTPSCGRRCVQLRQLLSHNRMRPEWTLWLAINQPPGDLRIKQTDKPIITVCFGDWDDGRHCPFESQCQNDLAFNKINTKLAMF